MSDAPNKWINNPWPIKAAIVFFILSVIWFGRDLDFSAYAHPDERNKIKQIIDDEYNFNHPMLMLSSAQIVGVVLDKNNDFESVKLIGRWVSVIYASLAVSILVLSMGKIYGLWIAIASGLLLMSNPHLFELSHYFKEDPTLLFGIAASVFSIVLYSLRPDFWAALLCGATAGIAFSGKYAGIMVMPFALYVVIDLSRSKWRDGAAFFVSFSLAFLIINFPAFLSLRDATGSLDREIVRLSGAQQEVPRKVPHLNYVKMYSQSSTPIMLGLLIAYIIGLIRRRFQLSPVEWVITLMPFVYFIILSLIPVTSSRYFLPCGVMLACLSAIGLKTLLEFRFGKIIAVLLIVISLLFSVKGLVKVNSGFKEDHVGELADYLENNIPKNSILLVGKWIGIPPITSPKIKNHSFSPGETLSSLRNQGYTHILLERVHYRNFIDKNQNMTNMSDEDFFKLKEFYESLFREANLLRHWKPSNNKYLGKEMVLFSIQ